MNKGLQGPRDEDPRGRSTALRQRVSTEISEVGSDSDAHQVQIEDENG